MSRTSQPRPWPRFMKRETAAAYLELSIKEFEQEISRGNVPPPIMLGNAPHWSQATIDAWLDKLAGDNDDNPFANTKLYASL